MQIRALSGFSENTIQRYGRPYTPVGNITVLGGIGNTDIPVQQVAVKDPKTGKTKLLTVDNINALTNLIQQGFKIVSDIKGKRGERVKPPQPRQTLPPPQKAGINPMLLLGFGALALIILITKNK